MNHDQSEPVVLELALPPRETLGAFLLLGVGKDAAREEIEAHWAQRLIWARKNQFRMPLEDINWAREVINDRERRPRADAGSLTADTSEHVLRRLEERPGGDGKPITRRRLGWRPLDAEKPWAECSPSVAVPDPEAVRDAIRIPDIPQEVPAVATLLQELARMPLDPWALPADLERPSDRQQEPTA
jgi:hypothetical protein